MAPRAALPEDAASERPLDRAGAHAADLEHRPLGRQHAGRGWPAADRRDRPLAGAAGLLLGDGQTLVFHRGNPSSWFLATTNAAGEKSVLPLGENPFKSTEQVWFAPDGQTVYFVADLPGGLGGSDIWVTRRVPKGVANAAGANGATNGGR